MAAKTLPSTGAVTGLKETLDFFGDPQFAQKRFKAHGDVFETRLLNQRLVFIRGEQTMADLFAQGDALEGWWPESVRLELAPNQDLTLQQIPSPSPRGGLLLTASARHKS